MFSTSFCTEPRSFCFVLSFLYVVLVKQHFSQPIRWNKFFFMYLCQLSKCSQTPPPLRPSLSHCLLSAHGRCKPKRGFCQRQRVAPVYQRRGRTKFHPFFVFINRLPRTMLFQQGYLPIKKTKHHLSCVSKDITPSPISGNKIPKGAKFHLAW